MQHSWSSASTRSVAPQAAFRRRGVVRLAAVGLAVAALAGPVAACSSDGGVATGTAAEAVAAGTMVVDVRTPQEFAGGHLEGAVNIDIQGSDFDTRIAALDPAADYLVYCRSGNRSGQAIDRMRAAGFTGELTNLGSVDEASGASGLPVVR